jgi:hypothetical protein
MRRTEKRHALQAEAEESLRLLRVQCQEKEERAQLLLERSSEERELQMRGARYKILQIKYMQTNFYISV